MIKTRCRIPTTFHKFCTEPAYLDKRDETSLVGITVKDRVILHELH